MRETALSKLRRREGLPPDPLLVPKRIIEDMIMQPKSTAYVPTENGSRYLQQLCKHWGHNLDVSFTPEEGRVTFPKDGRSGNWPGEAVLHLQARVGELECELRGSVPEQVQALKGVVESHLDRFAFKEAPLAFDWRDYEFEA